MASIIINIVIMSISEITQSLSDKLHNDTLTHYELNDYLIFILLNFNRINDFNNYEDYKKSGSLFGVMLDDNDFENDPNKRQLIACIGYYIVSKGLEEFMQESFANPILKYSEAELLTLRLMLLVNSNASIKFTLSLFVEKDYTNFSILSDNRYKVETEQYENMLIHDSNAIDLIKFELQTPMKMGFFPFFDERIFIPSQKVKERFLNYTNLKDRFLDGRNIHKKMYAYLKNRFENDKNFDFE